MSAVPAAPDRTLDDLTLGKGFALEDLVDRKALGELAQSFYDLFRVPLRVYSEQGAILADVTPPVELYTYLNSFRPARVALQDVVTAVKGIDPGIDGDIAYNCVTGAAYRVVAVSYDARQIGKLILGPFLPPTMQSVPRELLSLDPAIDPQQTKQLLTKMPRAREETVAQIARHLRRSLDLILFSGHKALLTSNLHLASVRDSYRELEQKNVSLQQAVDRLKELDRLKSNFLATISHELRTPLTSIIGYSEMLAEGIAGDLNREQHDFITTIREKGEQLLELIKGILDLSKLESGTMSLRKDNVDVETVIRDVSQTLTPSARKGGVRLRVQVENGLPMVWGDAGRLGQVLLNLGENALKFTPRGGRVRMSARSTFMERTGDAQDPGHALFNTKRPAVELRVADTGIGIPEHERIRVFDAFYQVDSSSTREQGGTGLGLSIVQRLVGAHDGTVHVEGNSPQGAVFVVTVPCRRATIG